MKPSDKQITQAELHAFADGQLDGKREEAVASYLDSHPEAAAQVRLYGEINAALHRDFDPVLDEPLPARFKVAPTRKAAFPVSGLLPLAASLLIGIAVGWWGRGLPEVEPVAVSAELPRQAAFAHAVFTPEERHPVEVYADESHHLMMWLTKRLGTKIDAPPLTEVGYSLIGGRLLPGAKAPAAQFMYENDQGGRLTLYVATEMEDNHETLFSHTQEDGLQVFYWVEGRVGYALIGDLPKSDALRAARVAYRTLVEGKTAGY